MRCRGEEGRRTATRDDGRRTKDEGPRTKVNGSRTKGKIPTLRLSSGRAINNQKSSISNRQQPTTSNQQPAANPRSPPRHRWSNRRREDEDCHHLAEALNA